MSPLSISCSKAFILRTSLLLTRKLVSASFECCEGCLQCCSTCLGTIAACARDLQNHGLPVMLPSS